MPTKSSTKCIKSSTKKLHERIHRVYLSTRLIVKITVFQAHTFES